MSACHLCGVKTNSAPMCWDCFYKQLGAGEKYQGEPKPRMTRNQSITTAAISFAVAIGAIVLYVLWK